MYRIGEIITADSTPVLDVSIWDGKDGWAAEEWIEWYNLRVNKFGETEATNTFLSYWQQQQLSPSDLYNNFWYNDNWTEFLVFSPGLWAWFENNSVVGQIIKTEIGVQNIRNNFGEWIDTVKEVAKSAANSVSTGVPNVQKTLNKVGLIVGLGAAIFYAPQIKKVVKKFLK